MLRPDFEEINSVIAAVHQEVQLRIDAVSPFLGLINLLGGRSENAIIRFSMNGAREAAWVAACTAARPQCHPSFAGELDKSTARLGHLVLNPGRPMSLALRLVSLVERSSVPEVMAALG